jgi:hypothetical protein
LSRRLDERIIVQDRVGELADRLEQWRELRRARVLHLAAKSSQEARHRGIQSNGVVGEALVVHHGQAVHGVGRVTTR